MSHLDGGKKEAPDGGGDRRLDLGGGDKAEDLEKRGEKFRKTEEEEKNDVPEEYKEALELVGSLAMTLSEGPITVEKLYKIDEVMVKVIELAYPKGFAYEPLFDTGQLYQRWGLTTPTTKDGVTFWFYPDGAFHIEPDDPNRIGHSQWSLIDYKLMTKIFPYLGETEDSIDEINSRLKQYDAGGLSFYNPDAVRKLVSHGGDFGLVRNGPTGKTYQLRYDSTKHCLRVDERLELEGPPR